ncbi:nucleotide-diphospho-sugar transferase [Cladochytrium replicatum]|nr:nucleotide-diphospho-sugar transferase [Cladochytrium replicatum]
MSALKGVVLVGGPSVGTRFRPLSMDLPKPLFPIAGSPMVYHHVAALAKLPGMKEILLIGFFDQSIFDRFLTEVQMEFYHISIRYLREYQSLGTAGGIYHFRDEILRSNPDSVFVMNADICTSFPLPEMLAAHHEKKSLGTLLAIQVDRADVHKYGSVVVTPDTHEVLHFVEKPETFVSDLISCGIYLFDKEIFRVIQDAIKKKRQREEEDPEFDPTVPRSSDERIRLEQDVLTLLTNSQKLFAYVCNPQKDFWMQIKTGSSTIPANKLYLQHFRLTAPRRLSNVTRFSGDDLERLRTGAPPSGPELIQPVTIHATAIVHPTAKIGPNVSIGPRVLIGRGCRIRDSIILDGVEVRNDSCVISAVVGWESKIGAWTRIEGAPGDAQTHNATVKGFKIPTATILGKDVSVADETVIRNCIVLPHKELKSSFQNEILM